MKSLDSKKMNKQRRRRQRNRLISILTAIVVFVTTYALVLPAVAIDSETAAQEPGMEIAQAPAPEALPEAAPAAAEPAGDQSAPIEAVPAAADTAEQPAADAPAETITDENVPMAAPEAAGDALTPEPVNSGSVVAESSSADSSTAVDGKEADNASEEKKDDASEEKKDDASEEKKDDEIKLAASPLTFDSAEYLVTVSFSEAAALPEGTTLGVREYAAGSMEYNAYHAILNQKLREDGVEEEDLEEAVSALRLYELSFINKDGAQILPLSAVDVLVEYKTPTNPVADESLYAVTFRTDDGQPTKATFNTVNAADGSACVEAAGGVIQKLRVQGYAANDTHTNNVIGQLLLKQNGENEEAEATEDTAEAESAEGLYVTRNVPVEGAPYGLILQYGPEAGIPEDAAFRAVPLDESYADYDAYKDRALSAQSAEEGEEQVLLGLFDLTIYDAEGNVVEPLAPVTVTVEMGTALDTVNDVYAVHFVDTSVAPSAEEIAAGEVAPAETAPLEVCPAANDGSEATFSVESLSVIAVVGKGLTKEITLPGSNDIYEVTVTYGPEAQIPDGAALDVTTLAEDSSEYAAAKDAVVAVKKAEDEDFDENDLGFAALDITIKDDQGVPVEPAEGAEVKVSIQMKKLPESASEETLAETMEIQHLNEATGIPVVETVAEVQDVTVANGTAAAEFTVTSFSTFTLTWTDDGSSSGVSDDAAKATLNIQENGNTYATVTVHYVDVHGNNITRPVNAVVNGETPITLEDLLKSEIDDYEYQGIYYDSYYGEQVTTVTAAQTSQEVNVSGIQSRSYSTGGYTDSAAFADREYYQYNNLTGPLYWGQYTSGYFANDKWYLYTVPNTDSWYYRYNGNTVYYATSGTETHYNTTVSFNNDDGIVNTLESGLIADSTYATGADIYVVYQSTDIKKHATIHFGYSIGTEFVEFDETTINFDTDADSFSLAVNTGANGYVYRDAVYCAPDVEFENGVDMGSTIYKAEVGFEYDEYSNDDYSTTTERKAIEDGSNIYAVYFKPESGRKPGADDDSVPNPSVTKNVTPNGDGTYQIQLDVVGKTVSEDDSHYVNILVILDATQSMSGTKWTNAKAAMKALIETLVEGDNAQNAGKIDFSLVTFGRAATVVQGWTKDNVAFKTTCAGLKMVSTNGTNWEAGMRGGLYGVLNTYPEGETAENHDPTYVIFLTDGDPNVYYQSGSDTNYSDTGTTPGWNQNSGTSATQSKDEAKAIAASTYLYGIYCGSSGTTPSGTSFNRLRDVIQGIGQGGVDTIAANADTIESEFKKIAETALANMGSSNVSVDDGITELSAVSAQVVGTAGAFEYQISTDGENWSDWAEAPGASFSEDNGVTWDLSSVGTVMEGQYYRIRFTVWPSQEAYDLVADVNNGIIHNPDGTTSIGTPAQAYEALDQDAKDQLEENGGIYSLKTNTHLNIDYTFEGEEYADPGTTETEGHMKLEVSPISLKKLWPENHLDGYEEGQSQDGVQNSITLTVTKDDAPYLDVTLDKDNGWKKDNVFISYGVMTVHDGVAHVMEGSEGHDYTVIEPESFSYYWDLIADVYHPMVINGTPTLLVLDKSITSADNVNTFKIGDSYYKVHPDNNMLLASNYRRANLNLTKTVTNENAPKDAWFTYTVTVTEAAGKDVWFSAWDNAGIVKNADWVISGATAEEGNTGYYYASSGSTITFKIKAGWNVRFINLLHGSTYSIEETGMDDGFTFASVVPSKQFDFDDTTLDPNAWVDHYDAANNKTTGTIIEPNNSYTLTYSNTWTTTEVQLKKVDDKNNTLAGSAFDLSRLNNSNAWESIRSGIKPGDSATQTPNPVDLEGLGVGRYKLTETEAPDGFIILKNNVYFEIYKDVSDGKLKARLTDESGAASTSTDPATMTLVTEGDSSYYLVTVKNTPGTELPMTGGTGTLPFTLGGIGLILASALMYGFRMRRRERRLN